MPNLITLKEAAIQLSVDPQTLRLWIRDGKISAIKMPNAEYRFSEAHLQAWLNSRTVKARAL